jgi:hypothetical protein
VTSTLANRLVLAAGLKKFIPALAPYVFQVVLEGEARSGREQSGLVVVGQIAPTGCRSRKIKLTSTFGGGNDLFRNEEGGTVRAATNRNAEGISDGAGCGHIGAVQDSDCAHRAVCTSADAINASGAGGRQDAAVVEIDAMVGIDGRERDGIARPRDAVECGVSRRKREQVADEKGQARAVPSSSALRSVQGICFGIGRL